MGPKSPDCSLCDGGPLACAAAMPWPRLRGALVALAPRLWFLALLHTGRHVRLPDAGSVGLRRRRLEARQLCRGRDLQGRVRSDLPVQKRVTLRDRATLFVHLTRTMTTSCLSTLDAATSSASSSKAALSAARTDAAHADAAQVVGRRRSMPAQADAHADAAQVVSSSSRRSSCRWPSSRRRRRSSRLLALVGRLMPTLLTPTSLLPTGGHQTARHRLSRTHSSVSTTCS